MTESFAQPQVPEAKNSVFGIPTECPSCGNTLKFQGEYLFCANGNHCPAQQSGLIKRWVKKLDIKDWGDSLIEALCEVGMVKSIADLYGLDEEILAEITLSGKKVGTSTAKKVMKNLRDKLELRIADFVGSLGIDLWGRSMVKFLVEAGYDTLEKMEDAAVGDIAKVPGVGETKATAFVDGFGRRKKMMDDLLAAGVVVKRPMTGGKLAGFSFCFTGIRDPSFAAEIEDAGGQIKSSVGKGLTYLVAKDSTGTSGKLKKARDQGTKVISLEEAKALL